MSYYKVTDTELTAVANAIRTKGGTQAQLKWNADFISAINAISGGGGGNNVIVLDTQYDTEHIYIGRSTPDNSDGSDGDYYYKRNIFPFGGVTLAYKGNSYWNSSSTSFSGYKFTPTENIQCLGLSGRARSSGTGTLLLYNVTDSEDVVRTENISVEEGWNDVYFDNPITLTSGKTYIVAFKFGQLSYMSIQSGRFSSKISVVSGVYGSSSTSVPSDTDSSKVYSADIILDIGYVIEGSYIKKSGSWVQL